MVKHALAVAFVVGLSVPNSASAEESGKGADDTFLDGLDWQVMASGFYLFNAHRVAGPYNNLNYPYTGYMGFGLNFAGGDVSYTGEKFALTLGLRWGTAAPQLTVLAPLKEGYASWMPHEKLTFDFGWFDSIYGVEVADEWNNATFTRGNLYFLLQPFNHLGLRITADLDEIVTLRFLVVSDRVGVGRLGGSAIDAEAAPSFGAQVGITPVDRVTLQLGYLAGPSGLNGNRAWGQFFDLLLSAKIRRFTLIFNGNATVDPPARSGQYEIGAALSGDMEVHRQWRVGARVEYIAGTVDLSDGRDPDLLTVTATARYMPVQYLVISLEPRFERAQQELFFTRDSQTDPSTGDKIADSNIYFGFVLGVSAFIGN
ncbi:MAG: outer membrane beta-barrel protein [Polyangiales bacterium]